MFKETERRNKRLQSTSYQKKKKKEVNKDFLKRKRYASEYEMEKYLGTTPVNLIETFKQRRKMAITSF